MNLTTYGIFELTQTIQDDAHAVRDEAAARQAKLAAKIIKARAKLAAMEKENNDLIALFNKAVMH